MLTDTFYYKEVVVAHESCMAIVDQWREEWVVDIVKQVVGVIGDQYVVAMYFELRRDDKLKKQMDFETVSNARRIAQEYQNFVDGKIDVNRLARYAKRYAKVHDELYELELSNITK